VRWLIVLISLISTSLLFAITVCGYEMRYELMNYLGLTTK
jgi:hypothetical protein